MPFPGSSSAAALLRQVFPIVIYGAAIVAVTVPVPAASTDLGSGFRDHGVAVPISSHRGMAATVDGQGRNVLLVWLMDHRGGYELLMIDAESGKCEEFPIPFPNDKGDSPFASLLSSANRFYTHFGDHFVEFDPVKRAFTFSAKTTPQMAMGMTEDDQGVIWSVTYPQSGVVSFDPKSRKFHDYGQIYEQSWPQYQRFVAADDSGWIYFALGQTASQIIAFDPATGKATPMLPESERAKGSAFLYRSLDGKVYGQARRGTDNWYEFHHGSGKKIGTHEPARPKPTITGSQTLAHLRFPDGTEVESCNLIERRLWVKDARTSAGHASASTSETASTSVTSATADIREVPINYASEGAHIMSVAAAPGGVIAGGTAFPMRFFSLDPETDKLSNRPAYGQWNTVARHGDRFFVGGYGGGFLLEWDPSRPWVNTERGDSRSNPLFLTQVSPVVHRPHRLLPLRDGRSVVMGGTPEYGYTGGGLLFWDRATSSQAVLKDTDVVPDQSTMSLLELPDGKLLGGTTTAPGTGGEKKAQLAELYTLDPGSKSVIWHAPLLPGVQAYHELFPGRDGLVYGIADLKLFFVFDPAKREVIHRQDLEPEFGLTNWQQGPRTFVAGANGSVYLLLANGIASLDTRTHKLTRLATSPVKIDAGGGYLDGRIYFAHGSHLCSYQLESAGK